MAENVPRLLMGGPQSRETEHASLHRDRSSDQFHTYQQDSCHFRYGRPARVSISCIIPQCNRMPCIITAGIPVLFSFRFFTRLIPSRQHPSVSLGVCTAHQHPLCPCRTLFIGAAFLPRVTAKHGMGVRSGSVILVTSIRVTSATLSFYNTTP